MKNIITLKSQKISYIKKYSAIAKSIRISIKNGEVILTIPKPWFFQSKESIEKKALAFLESKKDWILKHLIPPFKGGLGGEKNPDLQNYSREHYLKYREQARILCKNKCRFWSEKMWVSYNRIAIKSLKTKWWSCSSKKNLNFSYKIIFLSPEKQDYLIVHELAHLKYMNHSNDFWDFVCETLWNKKFKRFKI